MDKFPKKSLFLEHPILEYFYLVIQVGSKIWMIVLDWRRIFLPGKTSQKMDFWTYFQNVCWPGVGAKIY